MLNIKRYLSSLLLVFLTAACSEQGKVKTLTDIDTGLTVSWLLKDENIKEECSKFQPTREQILKFFNKAQRVEGFVVTKDRYTPCFTSGQITWRNGSSASWNLYSSGTASLLLDNGETIYLYQRDYHWFDPTECTYGLGDEGEC